MRLRVRAPSDQWGVGLRMPERQGQVKPYYQDKQVTLYHGDVLDVVPSLEDGSIDTAIADPPFFMPAQQYAGRDKVWTRTWSDTSVLTGWWDYITKTVEPKIGPAGHHLTFCDDEAYAAFFPVAYRYFPNLACLTWDKTRPGMGSAWRSSAEFIIAARRRAAYWAGGATGTVLAHKPVPQKSRIHPVDKPVDLLKALIEPTTPEGGTVLDLFSGGGSAAVAARALGRKVISVEMEESYCEKIATRLSVEQPVLL